jgi:transcription factor C subunit 7
MVSCSILIESRRLTEHHRRFSGDESFNLEPGKAAALDAGSGLGVVVEGKKNPNARLSPSRL